MFSPQLEVFYQTMGGCYDWCLLKCPTHMNIALISSLCEELCVFTCSKQHCRSTVLL